MKKLFLTTLIGSLLVVGTAYAKGAPSTPGEHGAKFLGTHETEKEKYLEESFMPTVTLELSQMFYGKAGNYKTQTSHPTAVIKYDFAPKWDLAFQWDRLWNMYRYDGGDRQQNNSGSYPTGTLTNTYGTLGDSKIRWSSSLTVRNHNPLRTKDAYNRTFIFARTAFDFAEYIPSGDYIQARQFAISPMYVYGIQTAGPKGHSNEAALALLTNWGLPANFSLSVNAYVFKEWNNGDFKIHENIYTNTEYDSATYFMFYAWLEYAKELYEFNDKTALTFNFLGGFDPYIISNRTALWEPWLAGQERCQWLPPSIGQSLEPYKHTYALFALPQLTLTYNHSESLSFNVFVQAKYSNIVWGAHENTWKWQPRGGVGLVYSF